jgi:hypothetical protein
MPTIATSQLQIPSDWNEFEDICADLFSGIWNDHNTVRYGRQGQRQNGVDIRGRLPRGGIAGVQCKGKRRWPPVKLTTAEIDEEVGKALEFQPPLSEFTIVTTALDDVALTAHVDAITERHRKDGLFSVHVLGWAELSRRIKSNPEIVEKYFGLTTLSSVRQDIQDVPERTARLLTESLRELGLPPSDSDKAATQPNAKVETVAPGMAQALQRDFAQRYTEALQRGMFPEALRADAFRNLAREIRESGITSLSPDLRRSIFLRASRSAALLNQLQEANDYLAEAQKLAGTESDLPAQARITEAQGDNDGAIKLLRDQKDADCRSVLLNVLARHKGDTTALVWYDEESLTTGDLTGNGVLTLAQIYLRLQNLEPLKQILAGLTDTQLRENPYLYYLRGAVRFASVLPKTEQFVALTGVPLDVRFARPIVPDHQLSIELDSARSDIERCISVIENLGLREAARIAETYLTWCDLLHPQRREVALIQLRNDMQDPAKALSRVQFALTYDAETFDPKPLTQYLEKRDGLGGLNSDELRAALVLRLHANNPAAVAEFISKHRAQFDHGFNKIGIAAIEIQALAMANDVASAKQLLDANKSELGDEGVARLSAEIARAEGADPVAEYRKAYDATKTADALRALIGALMSRDENRAIGPLAEDLYKQTGDPRDIANAAKAYANASDDENFLRVADAYPTLRQSEAALASFYAWGLFRRGRYRDAQRAAQELAADPASRDLNLEVALAVETGDWEALAQPLSAFLQLASQIDGATLIRAANLAQTSGQGRLEDLIDAAVSKSPNDPNVLIGAYSLVIEEGLEDKEPEAHKWFSRALDLSGPDGPVRRFELKDLLSQQVEWTEHTRSVSDAITSGEMSLVVAAPGLRTTLIDITLRNLVRNAALPDSRRRVVVPLFSGRRVPTAIGDSKRLALDISTLMTLGWLGLLPKVFDTFPEFVLAARTLFSLFEGRRRIRQAQKSRLERAEKIRDLIARHRFKVLPASNTPQDTLVAEVGSALADLIRAAEANGGLVVRPPPVHKLGLEETRDADLSAHASVLTDMHKVLDVLRNQGAVDATAEETAKRYFEVQDKGWPSAPTPEPKKPLYLDSLAIIYLHTVGLLDAVVNTFPEVHIDASAEDEALSLIEHERHTTEVLRVIDDIRDAVRKAYQGGKIIFGPRWSQIDNDTEGLGASSLHLLGDFLGSDAVAFDDRALNKEPFGVDNKQQQARIVTSLDIIEELHARKILSDSEQQAARHRLRVGGACLVPILAAEIKLAAARNGQNESPEFRAIRDSIDLARVGEIPRFPAEIPWLLSITGGTKAAMVEIWKDEPDAKRAAAIADDIRRLYPDVRDWIVCWHGQTPPNWAASVNRMLTATLAFPFELSGLAALRNYNEWVERAVFDPIRANEPDTYQGIIDYTRNFILSAADHDNDGS